MPRGIGGTAGLVAGCIVCLDPAVWWRSCGLAGAAQRFLLVPPHYFLYAVERNKLTLSTSKALCTQLPVWAGPPSCWLLSSSLAIPMFLVRYLWKSGTCWCHVVASVPLHGQRGWAPLGVDVVRFSLQLCRVDFSGWWLMSILQFCHRYLWSEHPPQWAPLYLTDAEFCGSSGTASLTFCVAESVWGRLHAWHCFILAYQLLKMLFLVIFCIFSTSSSSVCASWSRPLISCSSLDVHAVSACWPWHCNTLDLCKNILV